MFFTAALSPALNRGLARRYLMPSGFLMRPLLNGGTLGRLQRLSEFLLFEIVIDSHRRSVQLDQIGFTGGTGLASGSIGLPEHERRIQRLADRRVASSFRHCSREEDRAISIGPRDGETGGAAVKPRVSRPW